jgi:methionyl-tRNA synthetase
LSAGIKAIVFYLHDVNRYFSANEPWVLSKQLRAKPGDAAVQERLDTVLYVTIDSVRLAGTKC